ncbi:hypothetical protein [Thiospirochaeta perfilievii]|nr:hypothetical protein [Thiospirochaeta perfilievii]
MTIEFLEIAYDEYKDAIEYYDLMETGLGNRFKEEVDLSLERVI